MPSSDWLYHPRADEQRPDRAEKRPVPVVHFPEQQEFDMSCQLPGGRIAESPATALPPPRELLTRPSATEQNRQKRREHTEGHGLRDHAALRNDPCQGSEQFLRKRD